MKVLKHEWSEKDLVIAYYISKWDYNGLGIDEYDLIDSVIPNSTVQSLSMQVANFRHLLNIDGYKLSDSSKLMKVIVDKYDGVPAEKVKGIVSKIIDGCDVELGRGKRSNKAIDKKKLELNAELERNYQAKLKLMKNMGRNLKRVS